MESKHINLSLILALASIIGAVIPVLGLILGAVAFAWASSVVEQDQLKRRNIVRAMALIGIGLSLISSYIWFSYYESKIQSNKVHSAQQLQACLDQADFMFQAKVSPHVGTGFWAGYESDLAAKTQQEADCRTQFPGS